ncbi:MAG: ABC transporter ATP-binding protein [Bryobacterales bacterium]|jgi:heme ABC exporter ATP-binding subunit CcmA|nr:ABC transporter ATP-binding protein [Bryobacterales bacterium]
MMAVDARRVTRYFGVYAALRQASFQIPPGACMALLGRNGAGKTTLIRLLAGLNVPSEGAVTVFGADPTHAEGRRSIGFLGHGSGLYDELSAEENLLLAARVARLPDAAAKVREWLRRVQLERVAHNRPHEYSRGMRQRLALARVLIGGPRLLLLDEPLTALDDRATAMVRGLLQEAIADGATLLMSTHHLSEGMQLASHVLLLDRGAVVYCGERTHAMLTDPASVYALCGDKA